MSGNPPDTSDRAIDLDGAIGYHVRHLTSYRYGEPMTRSRMLAHLVPRATPHQLVHDATLSTTPPAEHRHTHIDAFGNLTTYVEIEAEHDHLDVIAESTVHVRPTDLPIDRPWDDVVYALDTDLTADGELAHWCRLDSALVERSDLLDRYARESFTPSRGLVEAVRELTHRIFTDFEFDPHATDVATPLADVIRIRRGVCQDFAHLAIGCLRSIGLPARYVSGYLETIPPPGMTPLIGADASHAWIATYVPGFGWFDADPTNDVVPPERHITLAWGRDYHDVAPLRGTAYGPPTTQALEVSVDVRRQPTEPSRGGATPARHR